MSKGGTLITRYRHTRYHIFQLTNALKLSYLVPVPGFGSLVQIRIRIQKVLENGFCTNPELKHWLENQMVSSIDK